MKTLKIAVVVALAAALVAGGAYWRAQRTGPAERTEFSISVLGEVSHLAISRGRKVAGIRVARRNGGSSHGLRAAHWLGRGACDRRQ